MADAPDLGSGVLDVGVQVPLSAPGIKTQYVVYFFKIIAQYVVLFSI